jgi:recombination protein U
LLPATTFIEYIESIDRKSIPIDIFREKAYLIKDGYQPRIDYLKIVDNLIGGK